MFTAYWGFRGSRQPLRKEVRLSVTTSKPDALWARGTARDDVASSIEQIIASVLVLCGPENLIRSLSSSDHRVSAALQTITSFDPVCLMSIGYFRPSCMSNSP
ncbi:hypothetical protein RRG08_007832 [Elysia crispata]|uniref:Uncharacterized protein n=1 Tax=Elysia crispata TaxID=231223 RepID=A0AAE0XWM3_9GAST|nr:hypothetical protein RRG08_007832 [Elysia crispata]